MFLVCLKWYVSMMGWSVFIYVINIYLLDFIYTYYIFYFIGRIFLVIYSGTGLESTTTLYIMGEVGQTEQTVDNFQSSW